MLCPGHPGQQSQVLPPPVGGPSFPTLTGQLKHQLVRWVLLEQFCSMLELQVAKISPAFPRLKKRWSSPLSHAEVYR